MTTECRISFRKAKASEAEILAAISKRAFHNDVHYGAPPGPPGGPPGYDSAAWQKRVMRFGDYTTLLASQREGGLVACGTGALRIDEIQPAGGRRMSVDAWLRGTPVSTEVGFV